MIGLGGASDPVAAVVGFAVATVINYFGHQFWTFQKAEGRASWRRFLAFSGVVVLTLLVRVLVLSFLGPVLSGSGLNAPLRLGLAATVSFFVSFLMSKFLVFRHKVRSSV
jgi:putative flippase GtrA